VIVAVVAVRMVQVAVHQIVDVIAVRYRLVAASRAVHVVGVMALALMVRRAGIRVLVGHLDDVLIHVVIVGVVQMAIVEIVDVAVVQDAGMAAVRAVLMGMIVMNLAAHGDLLG
jgi:hypothetical protein